MNQYQLPTYNLYIHPNDLREMRMDIWNEDPFQASIKIDKKKLDIDLLYRGSHTRKFKKKSYNIQFYKPKFFLGAKEFHLNAEYKDISLMRNKLSFDFFNSIGVIAPSAHHVFLNLNGKPEGIYLQLESVDEHFFKKRNYPLSAVFYAVDGDANFSLLSDLDKDVKNSLDLGYEMKFGDKEDTAYLQQLIYKINTLPRNEFKDSIKDFVHVNQYLRWLAGVILTQNYDGFVHNYSLIRNKESGLFEVSPWDYDGTWGRDVNGKVMDYDYVRIEGFNTLTARLLDVPEYRKEYKSLLETFIQNEFTIDFMHPKIDNLYQTLRPYVTKDPYIKQNLPSFDQEPAFILKYIEDRRNYILENLARLD
jgi:spore coat protein H